MPTQPTITPEPDGGVRDAMTLILAFLALRLVVSLFFPATIDEAYAIAVSRDWSLSYYDHPPLGFTIAQAMAWLTGSTNIFVIRLPFILAGAASSWLVWDITRLAYGQRAAYWALGWFCVAPFFFISSGHFVVPDGPLNLALLATLRLVLPDLLSPDKGLRAARWLAAGFCFAVALASKYQAILFGASALSFLLASPPHRRLLLSPVMWMTLVVGALGLMPMVAWNAAQDWISFGFQAGRAADDGTHLHPANFIVTILGQIVYLLPGTWAVMMWMSVRGILRPTPAADRIFGWFVVVPVAIFLAIALISTNSLPHWAMSGFVFGFPLVGRWCEAMYERYRRWIDLAWRASVVGIPLLALGVGLQASHAVFTRPFFDAAPKQDLNWQMQHWSVLADRWEELGAPNAVVTVNWMTGAKAGHALGPGVAILPLDDPRHFQFLERPEHASAIAVHPSDVGDSTAVIAEMLRLLQAGDYRTTGEPQVLRQMSGTHPRFEIVVIPVEPES